MLKRFHSCESTGSPAPEVITPAPVNLSAAIATSPQNAGTHGTRAVNKKTHSLAAYISEEQAVQDFSFLLAAFNAFVGPCVSNKVEGVCGDFPVNRFNFEETGVDTVGLTRGIDKADELSVFIRHDANGGFSLGAFRCFVFAEIDCVFS